MAGPCGCKGAGCGCCFIENPSSEVPYEVFGSGSPSDCVSLNIKNIVTTLVDNGDGTLTYTNELGNSVAFFDGEHYSVDVVGELVGDTTVPNVVAALATSFGALNALTVTITNPSTVLDMSIHTSGTGEEFVASGARTTAASQFIAVNCVYSLNGAPAVAPISGGGQVGVPLTNGELRSYNLHSAPPIFVATVPPGGAWFLRLVARQYVLTGLRNAGTTAAQGQKIAISGSTTV